MEFQHKKSLGQHFLNSELVPEWLCEAGAVSATDTILEIGPGTGALTRTLLARGAHVIALETDPRAVAVLHDTFADAIAAKQLIVHTLDVRELKLDALGVYDQQFKVVANIPYYLSGQLFRTLLQSPIQPNTLVFLVQKEVAKRAAAQLPPAPNAKGSLLALATQSYGNVRVSRSVSRGHFTPVPNVDSAIIQITDIDRSYFDTITETDFFTLIRLGFGQKRKQLFGLLKPHFEPVTLQAAFASTGLIDTVRAEDISLAQWRELTKILYAT